MDDLHSKGIENSVVGSHNSINRYGLYAYLVMTHVILLFEKLWNVNSIRVYLNDVSIVENVYISKRNVYCTITCIGFFRALEN